MVVNDDAGSLLGLRSGERLAPCYPAREGS
jgi:hypothetical protein